MWYEFAKLESTDRPDGLFSAETVMRSYVFVCVYVCVMSADLEMILQIKLTPIFECVPIDEWLRRQ